MLDLEFVQQFMMQNFDQTTLSNNGTHFLARCILCGDSKKSRYKKRFNLDFNNGVPGWKCFNCGRNGNFIEIYSIVKGISYDDAKDKLFSTWNGNDDIKNRYKRKKKKVDKPKIKLKVKEDNFNWIKDDCYTLNSSNSGILEKKYISKLNEFYKQRKIPERYKIYICYKGKYKGRIIIPIFNENKNIIYFQARRIPKSKIEPKYDNPISPKEFCILNKNLFDKKKYIIITEGLIDAFTIGDQATSCLGKEVSENLIVQLLKLTDKNVIVCLDNDKEAYKSLSKFMKNNKYAKKLKYFLYPPEFSGHGDINNYVSSKKNKVDVYELIIKNSVNHSIAYTKLKMEGKIR